MTAKQLRMARTRLGWSQRQLGEALGFGDPITSISRRERGETKIARAEEIAIGHMLNCKP